MTGNAPVSPFISTWDGEAVAPDPPYGACIVVRRGDAYLILRRRGAMARGVWEWTPLSEAIRLCRPQSVADGLAMASLI